jgi:hypothetical protein
MSRASEAVRVLPGLRGLFTATLVPAILASTALVGLVTWQALQATILRGFDEQLRAVATTTGVFIDGDDHQRILGPLPGPDGPATPRDEDTPLYRGHVEPMQAVMDRRGLTYLYTQVLGDAGAIHYVLDATRGDEHSPIGSPDQLPESQIAGAEAVVRDGVVYISEVQRWDAWGLLKSAFAPIRTRSGEVVAMSGADIDIGVIEAKTRQALLQVLFAGSLALAFGTLLALALAHRMAIVLGAVREGALRMASGAFDTQLESPALLELRRLTQAFNQMSRALRQTLDELRHEGFTTRARRARERLRARWRAASAPPRALPAGAEWQNSAREQPGAATGWVSGVSRGEDLWALWWQREPASEADGTPEGGGGASGGGRRGAGGGAGGGAGDGRDHQRAVIASALRSLCERGVAPESWPRVVEALAEFGLDRVIRFDPHTGIAHHFGAPLDPAAHSAAAADDVSPGHLADAAESADAAPPPHPAPANSAGRWAFAVCRGPQGEPGLLTLPAPSRWVPSAGDGS